MLNFLKLKSSQGPWGPWTKKQGDNPKTIKEENIVEEVEEKTEDIKNGGQGPENNEPNQNNNGDKDPKKDDKKDEDNKDSEDKKNVKEEKPKEEKPKEEKSPIEEQPKGENSIEEQPKEETPKEEPQEEEPQEEEPQEENIQEESPSQPIIGPWGDSNPKISSSNNPKYDKIIKDLIGNSERNSGGGSNNGGNNGDFVDKFSQSPKKFISLAILALIAFWLATGFYKVDPDENAIVLYFGKFHGIATPGLNYRVPFPVGKAIKQRITAVNSEEFGYSKSSKRSRRGVPSRDGIENLMLTGDENIVDIEFQVQWQIRDIEEFTFNIEKPRLAIRQAAQSAMREIIARTPISEALSDGKSQIELSTKELLQQTLDSYSAGVRITLVQLRRVDPPSQVIDAFRDVQTAKADKEREINESQAYANDVIPRARGNAAEMEEKAEGYKRRVEADAMGEAKRFLALYYQYKGAKEVTRKRMYLQTMSKVYGDIDKIIIDKRAASGSVFPYFPLNEFNKNNSSPMTINNKSITQK